MIEEAGDGELVVFDVERQRIHRLNDTAALVWQACQRSAPRREMESNLRESLGVDDIDGVIDFAIRRFGREAAAGSVDSGRCLL